MLSERTNKEIIIKLPLSLDTEGLQRLVDFFIYKEASSKSKATQRQVDKLAKSAKKGWWKAHRVRYA